MRRIASFDIATAAEQGLTVRRHGASPWANYSLEQIAGGDVPISGRDEAVRWLGFTKRLARVFPASMKPLARELIHGSLPDIVIEGGGRLQRYDLERVERIVKQILCPRRGEAPSSGDREWLNVRLARIDPDKCYLRLKNGGGPTERGAAIGIDPRSAHRGSWAALGAQWGSPTSMLVASVMVDGTILAEAFPLPGAPDRRPFRFERTL